MTGKVIFVCMLLLLGSVLILGKLYRQERKENYRLRANQETLFSQTEYYRTRDSLSVAGVERLTLSNREFSRYCSELKQNVTDLEIKIRRLQLVSRTATESVYSVKTVVKDSLISGRSDTLRCMDFRNSFLTFSGCVEEGIFRGQICSRDTLIQAIHRVPRKFWFVRWGTKAIRQEILSRNPYTRIVYSEYIELKR